MEAWAFVKQKGTVSWQEVEVNNTVDTQTQNIAGSSSAIFAAYLCLKEELLMAQVGAVEGPTFPELWSMTSSSLVTNRHIPWVAGCDISLLSDKQVQYFDQFLGAEGREHTFTEDFNYIKQLVRNFTCSILSHVIITAPLWH